MSFQCYVQFLAYSARVSSIWGAFHGPTELIRFRFIAVSIKWVALQRNVDYRTTSFKKN